jgi:hypothetical protein
MTALLLALALLTTPPSQECKDLKATGWVPKRNQKQVDLFKKDNPCPTRCKVYVRDGSKFVVWKVCGRCQVDHVCPLACCGSDTPDNMAWLTTEENLAKGDDCTACIAPGDRP